MPISMSREVADTLCEAASRGPREVVSEGTFRRMLAIERKRTERSNEPFLLVLLQADHPQRAGRDGNTLDKVASSLLSCTRETDVVGWYKSGVTVCVMYTGLVVKDKNAVLTAILNRINIALRKESLCDQLDQVTISFHFFPDNWGRDDSVSLPNPALYPDIFSPDKDLRSAIALKRVMDVVGSALLLILLFPVFMIIALAIKLTSRGAIFYKQKRVGQHGHLFTMLKFRSMQTNADSSVHKEFIGKFISKNNEHQVSTIDGEYVYKLSNDQRVTTLGRILRRISFDELPQLINVLKGDMSMVGPRPPIPYEVAVYQTWHRRRVLEVKPGITGLWQIGGRSRVMFDEMVRMDIRYVTTWTLWLDLKILIKTPMAVLKGSGAY